MDRHDNCLSTSERLFKADRKPLLSKDRNKSAYLAKFMKLQEQPQKARICKAAQKAAYVKYSEKSMKNGETAHRQTTESSTAKD